MTPTLAIFTPKQRRVLELCSLGWTSREIARINDVTEWAVSRMIWDANRLLPEDFYPDLDGPFYTKMRLLMWYAVAIRHEQLELAAA